MRLNFIGQLNTATGLLPKRVGAGLDSKGMGPPGSLPRKDLRDPQGALQIPALRSGRSL